MILTFPRQINITYLRLQLERLGQVELDLLAGRGR